MEWIQDIFIEYGPFVALPLVINFLMIGFKKAVKGFFRSEWGVRIAYFTPLVLGVLGGLLLPLEAVASKVLVGGALGAMSHYIYKFVTLTLASKTRVLEVVERKTMDLNKMRGSSTVLPEPERETDPGPVSTEEKIGTDDGKVG